jgi:hypothetical protein
MDSSSRIDMIPMGWRDFIRIREKPYTQRLEAQWSENESHPWNNGADSKQTSRYYEVKED